jgi:hypothetical protein
MAVYNPKKNLQIEIHANDLSGTQGYTVWRVIAGERKHTLSRKADGKDFDWMTDKQDKDFAAGKYKFSISAADASLYFDYIY